MLADYTGQIVEAMLLKWLMTPEYKLFDQTSKDLLNSPLYAIIELSSSFLSYS